MKNKTETNKAKAAEIEELVEKHSFLIKDFNEQLKAETAELEKISKRIDKLQYDITFHKVQITSIKTKRLFDYLHKCSKVLFARPGFDWIKIMPLFYGLNQQAVIIIKKPHLKAATIEIIEADKYDYFTLKQWQQILLFPHGGNTKRYGIDTARAIKQSAELKRQFSVVSAIMTSNYTKTNNQPVIQMVESYLFCTNNPHLKIG